MQFFNVLLEHGSAPCASGKCLPDTYCSSLTLEIRDEEGHSKALLCPDARENLWFSVQTTIFRLQKILFKGFLLAKLKFQWNFLTLLTLEIRERFRLKILDWLSMLLSLNPLEIRDEEGSSKVPLCPDARENLGFSVQTIIASLTEFTKMQILLRD